jgi:hypothetical protein
LAQSKACRVKFQELWRVASSANRSMKQPFEFTPFIGQCEKLAKRAKPSHRQISLEVAEGWKTVMRRLREEDR